MEASIVVGLVEVAKVFIQGYFRLMQMAGMSPEDIEAHYAEQKKYFEDHPPETLPDV